MQKTLLWLMPFALTLAACGSGLRYTHEVANGADFTNAHTVAFVPGEQVPEFERAHLNPEQLRAARAAAIDVLVPKGWSIVDDLQTADVVVAVGLGKRVVTTELSNSRIEYYEGNLDEETIVLDAVERETQMHVWHGQVRGIDTPSPPPERVAEAVRLVLSEFPAAGSRY